MRREATLHRAEIHNQIDQERTKNTIMVQEKEREQQEKEKIYN